MLKKLKNAEKVKRGPTDRPTDGQTYQGVESRITRLKRIKVNGHYYMRKVSSAQLTHRQILRSGNTDSIHAS